MTKPCNSENLRPFYQIQFPESLFRAQTLWNNIVRYIAKILYEGSNTNTRLQCIFTFNASLICVYVLF